MNPSEFIAEYRECFGASVPLPLAVVYADKPLSEPWNIAGCMFKQFHRAYKGETVTFDAESLTCGGGKLYTGLGPVQERIYDFVSKVEKYKQSPELVRGYITALNPRLSEKPYLNIVPVGNLDNFDEIEGLIFFVTPDVLSGLFAWANYDSSDLNAVMSPWGSGCASAITTMVNETAQAANIVLSVCLMSQHVNSSTMTFSVSQFPGADSWRCATRCGNAASPAAPHGSK